MGRHPLENRTRFRPMVRRCSACDVDKLDREFQSNQSKCRICRAAADKRRKYGLTHQQLASVQAVQSCEICGDSGDLVIDHDHDNEEVRGTLCHCCNVGLGHFRDSRLLLRRATTYLANHKTKLLERPKK